MDSAKEMEFMEKPDKTYIQSTPFPEQERTSAEHPIDQRLPGGKPAPGDTGD